ncbi:efflux RND transporter permease subunit [Paraburkholderia solisilvae]|uniref:Cobalt-zinc-cadmium resistance protein CzcA n=1 Tax=Paraburkholderia solisilvae TaxID=624376 RepID=A0A6J5DL95_9BURK|nr:efflux RND transporter permease subunit [Paraburkholderia solisilvae]CAB3754743.1 Cobalt-zinc-cadmium resistance protein CzcA [Paraburkholderia solisilvae]
MNAIVLIALRRPLTFVVMSILIILFGAMAVLKTPTDIFPAIRVPVIAVVWTYTGLSPQDMSGRVVYYYERALTATVANIEHIESQSLYGAGVVKIYFQPGTDIAAAQAQVTSISQTVLKQMPAGITPPQVLVYNASSVPVLNLQVSAPNMTSAQVFDMASNLIRPQLVSTPGVSIPSPYGGASLNVEIDLDQSKLLAHGLSAADVAAALGSQNVVLPAGDQKIGGLDFMVETNSTPLKVPTFNNLPIKTVNGATVYLRDVAYVHRGAPPQTNAVLVKGKQSVMIQIFKSGDASTLAVVAGIKRALPGIIRTLPPGVTITPLNDASGFVRDSVEDVVQEMITAAFLTGMTVLLFLGSWRSTLIVATSIPLAILSSILALHYTGQTINVMTLGGLALAVGILVDDATVMIENIDAHLETGAELEHGIITAANQIVVPTFVATLCICIVWLPLFQLDGISGYLFQPLAEAIIYAMIASFILSRTLVPTMAAWLLRGQVKAHGHQHEANPGFFTRFQRRFEHGFSQFRDRYRAVLTLAVLHRKGFVVSFMACAIASMGLLAFLGRDFFPSLKSNEIDMHMRAPIGTRLEDASKIADLVNDQIRKILPGQVTNLLDNCGLPTTSINLAYTSDGTIGPQDCDITISLKNEQSPVDDYRSTLRRELPKRFPGTVFTFLPGDITAKILNFGLPAPIDVQISGRGQEASMAYAQMLAARIRKLPGSADVNIQQAFNEPTLRVAADRSLASGMSLTEANIADNALATLSGSGQTAPTYWLDTASGVSHLVNLQTPQDQLTSMNDLETIPIDRGNGDPGGQQSQLLGALGTVTQTAMPLLVSHYGILPAVDIYVSNQGRDLGAVYDQIEQVVKEMHAQLPKGATVHLRGQATTMSSAYMQLLGGLALSVLLVYLVIVVNFQSWLDPFIIITALPGALAGIVWSLFLTHTDGSVPALTGAIMCMGTATANSILVVSFARERLAEHGDAIAAAIEAGYARIRPVLMTALAMIIGMLPMSMSNTQNAPLGRAVIGGLLVATVATLLFVPCVFAMMHLNDKKAAEFQP